MLCQLGTQHFMSGQAVLLAVLSDKKSLQAFPINYSLTNEGNHCTAHQSDSATKGNTLALGMGKCF